MIRLALLHPQPLVLAGLRRLVDGAPDLELVAAALDEESLLHQLRWMRPDVVVIDDDLTSGTGSLLRELMESFQAARVVLFAPRATPALRVAARMVGAHGIIDGGLPIRAVVGTIRRVAETVEAVEPVELNRAA